MRATAMPRRPIAASTRSTTLVAGGVIGAALAVNIKQQGYRRRAGAGGQIEIGLQIHRRAQIVDARHRDVGEIRRGLGGGGRRRQNQEQDAGQEIAHGLQPEGFLSAGRYCGTASKAIVVRAEAA